MINVIKQHCRQCDQPLEVCEHRNEKRADALIFADEHQRRIDSDLLAEGLRITPHACVEVRNHLIERLVKDNVPIIVGDSVTRRDWPDEERDRYVREAHERIRKNTIPDLKRAEIVLWNNDIFYGSINNWQAFDGAPCSLHEDFADQLWFWNVPLTTSVNDRPALLIAMLLINPFVTEWPDTKQDYARRAFAGIAFACTYLDSDLDEPHSKTSWSDRLICVPMFVTEMGKPLDQQTAQALASVEFLRLPFVDQSKAPAQNRAERRRLEREGRKGEIASIRIVTLRKSAASHAHSSAEDRERAAREWQCHWMVRGHWRKQFLPSTGGHRPTWIDPFLKGDASKPFHAPEVIFRAAR